jgi:hypothetical protein
MGFYEGMLWGDVPEAFRDEMQRHEYDFRRFGGESNDDVRARVQATLEILGRDYGGKTVVCVTPSCWLHELISIANLKGIIEDGWTNRQAIYETSIEFDGTLVSVNPIQLLAKVSEA